LQLPDKKETRTLVIYQIAVVPIFVNAGAAMLPAIVAAMTSLVALLLSPRAMWRLCRRKPWLPAVVVAIAVGLYYSPRLFSGAVPKPPADGGRAGANSVIDWPAIAREILRQQNSQSDNAVLTPLWHHTLDGHIALSTPAFFTDKAGRTTLYLPTTLLDLGDAFGVLFAIDVDSGKTLWSASTTGDIENGGEFLKPFFSSPAVSADGSRLAVGQGLHNDANCPLLCFDILAAEGVASRIVWSVKTPLHVESSPAIFVKDGRERVVVGAGAIEGGPDRKAQGNPGYVFCVDLATGKQLWQYPLNDPESSPAVDEEGTVYIGSGFNGNAVVAITEKPEARSQKPEEAQGQQSLGLLWNTPTLYPAVGDMTLASHPKLGKILLTGVGNGDYVFSDPKPAGLVIALDRATGKILWQTPMPDSVLGRLVVTADNAVVLAGCRDGQAYAIELVSGKILWRARVSASPNVPVLAGLAADSRHAFALAADGTLAILSLSDGRMLERMKLAEPSKAPQNLSMSTPVVFGDVLFVATETTGLHAFRIHS